MLKKDINILYDENNPLHESILRDLFKICFIDEHTVLHEGNIDIKENEIKNDDNLENGKKDQYPEGLKDDRWLDIGFQRNDPRTDFRGGGLFGLRAIIYFISNYRQK